MGDFYGGKRVQWEVVPIAIGSRNWDIDPIVIGKWDQLVVEI
jgi:hypothetical protein